MFLVDSHCHLDMLDLTKTNGDVGPYIARAEEQGVGHILCVSVNFAEFPNVLHIADTFVDVSASVGMHPTESNGHEPTVSELIEHGSNPLVVAVGETGLDYYRCEGDMTWQQDRFRHHIRAAREMGKPLIIHTRQAREDTMKILHEENAQEVGGVMHCFTEDYEMARQAIDLGFYISFSGIVTFKNAKDLQELAKTLPLETMMIETDAPYLAPVPHRGKPNEPAYVRHVAEFIADLREVDVKEIAKVTTKNFFQCFRPGEWD